VIPTGFLQDLLTRVDIVDVVGRHVQLKRGGANLMGLCPFHGEKSPSFSVSPSKQFYHCFGCGASGDAIRFLTEHLGLSFVEAVRELAQGVGLQVPEEQVSADEKQRRDTLRERRKSLGDVLAQAADFYRQQLKGHARAVDYLKRRGLSGAVAARFGLGFAPPGWRTLAGVFPSYDDPLLEEAGLVRQRGDEESEGAAAKDGSGRYDWFRDRVMFPIRAVSGEVIGFGGRVLDDSKPKYINSPETPVFSKGRELYGLFEARTAMRQRGYALVVEGYMDVVALAQSGFENAVATLGTACTADHVQKLFRFTESVVFSFDGDAAGRRAAGRALEAALPHAGDTREVKFLFLPAEHDPDSYVREHGAPAFEAMVQSAVPLSRQLIELAKESCDLSSAEGRARFLTHAKPMWLALPEGALKRQILPDLAQHGGLTVGDLNQLWQTAGGAAAAPAAAAPASPARPGGGPPAMAGRPPARRTNTTRHAPASPADHALRMLLLHSEWWNHLTADDHELLHGLPEPHGPVFAWLERQMAEHGAMPWAALEQGLNAAALQDAGTSLVPPSALQDEMTLAGLRTVLNGMWIQRLEQQQTELIALAATDPSALPRWRALGVQLDERRRARLEAQRESSR
jgi:DNA primase